MKRYYIVFEGRVQGVGFRFFCQYNAISLGLTGWVHNMLNGMVDMEIQGDDSLINNFLTKIKSGNNFIRVDNYSLKNLPINATEKSFKIQ